MLLKHISSVYPSRIREVFCKYIVFSGIKKDSLDVLGLMILQTFVLSIIIPIVLSIYTSWKFVVIYFILIFLGLNAITYTSLVLWSEKNARSIEKVLPDALEIFALNLRAGMEVNNAFIASNRPEFGALRSEIELVGKKTAYGVTFENALKEMSTRTKSRQLYRVIELMIFGIQSGGRLANLIDSLVDDLRQQKIIKEKIVNQIVVYVYYILIGIAIAAPFLFGVSSVLVSVISKVIVDMSLYEMRELPIKMSKSTVTPEFVFIFCIVIILVRVFMGSMMVSLISKGNKREGLKYLPFLVTIALLVFFLARHALMNLLGGYFSTY